jgi:hypothetical protein
LFSRKRLNFEVSNVGHYRQRAAGDAALPLRVREAGS